MKSFKIALPQQFSFDLTLSFLLRSPRELLHQVEDQFIYKALRVGQKEVVLRIQHDEDHLVVKIMNNEIPHSEKEVIAKYVNEWFDLETDLRPFYAMATKDALLSPLIKKYEGYRIVGQPDLFESLVWAVLGQQINLAFAYTLKQRFVEQFGSRISYQGKPYFLFPSPETTALLNDEKLLPLQFSRQKSKYVVLIAQAFASGEVSKEKLKGLPLQEAKEQLMKISLPRCLSVGRCWCAQRHQKFKEDEGKAYAGAGEEDFQKIQGMGSVCNLVLMEEPLRKR
jgi:DNA-3-methyladenine glycosylase II